MNYPSFGYFWQAEGSPWISEWGGQAFPWVIFSHMLRDGGSRKLSFLNMLAQLFSSLGRVPSRHFSHSYDDDPTNDSNG